MAQRLNLCSSPPSEDISIFAKHNLSTFSFELFWHSFGAYAHCLSNHSLLIFDILMFPGRPWSLKKTRKPETNQTKKPIPNLCQTMFPFWGTILFPPFIEKLLPHLMGALGCCFLTMYTLLPYVFSILDSSVTNCFYLFKALLTSSLCCGTTFPLSSPSHTTLLY